jgi:DNA repair protein RadB
MADSKISSGFKELDELLKGGYDDDTIITIYGPAGSGKTLLCLLAAIEIAKMNKKVVYIDTEGSFSVERVKQITPDYEHILSNFLIFKPTSFEEQKVVFEKLKTLITEKIGLIVVDTIAMLYRLELGKSEDIYETNRELGKQLGYLAEITRKHKIPVIIGNQIYANFEEINKVSMVGGDLLKYGSKCLIELQIGPNGKRRAIIKKHRYIGNEPEIDFKITEKGIEKIKEKFRLF